MRLTKRFFLVTCCVFSLLTANAQHRLWYQQPALVWTDALPLGNGRLGAMVYGTPATDRIQLNEETIWTGQPNKNPNPKAKAAIPKIQKLIFEGKFREAQNLADTEVMSAKNWGMAYQPFGNVYISMPSAVGYTNYMRELSLDSARAITRYTAGGVDYQREVITSFSDDVVMVRFTASKPGSITFNANYTTPHEDVIIKSEGDEATLEGVSSKLEGLKGKVRFMGRMAARIKGGSQSSADGVISVSGADEAVLYISIATNFVNYQDISGDWLGKSEDYLRKAMARDYEQSKKEHVAKFQEYMNRVSLNLGKDEYADVPTDKRLIDFANRDDNGLVATYFNFGRYLLICSSQPGGQAPNLQGIWNDKMFPSWDCKYTSNINLEMNYWPAEVANLTDLNEPFFRLISECSQTGKESAQVMYGKNGWVMHHNTDIWRVTGGIDHAASGMWMTCGAWLSRHLWEHYLYTLDKDFLKEYYPIMKGAAQFLDEMLIEEPKNGWLVISPSVSPENTHPAEKGRKQAIAAGTTMDVELLTELFSEIIEASKILGIDQELAAHYAERMKKFPPLQIGKWGQLQEWMEDWDDPNDTHRHVSHLYALYPGNQITKAKTPELFDAARTSLVHRGDPSTGWSMGWKVCLWARLMDGNHAYKLIHNQLTLTDDHFVAFGTNKKKGGTYRNLFDAHPPFQIDGNFGCAAGIAEMIMQSHEGYINILPAIPDCWKPEGEVKGLRARGAFDIVDLAWKDGKVTRLQIKSNAGAPLNVKVNGKMKKMSTKAGKTYSIKL